MEVCYQEIDMKPSDDLIKLQEAIKKVQDAIVKVQKYKSHNHYLSKYKEAIKNLNREYIYFKAKIDSTDYKNANKKIRELDGFVNKILSDTGYDEKLTEISNLELFWPDLEIEFGKLKPESKDFVIPSEIPHNEQRLDLDEAIKGFKNDCFLSSSVACRRAFEGALVEAYRIINNNDDPIEEVKCPHCKNTIRRSYIGIVNLHRWALTNGLIPDKLKPFGFMISDLGAGGAHPPLTDFPRDPEIAKLSIQTTITLLKQVFSRLEDIHNKSQK